jgi:Rod binding domain-containing protein
MNVLPVQQSPWQPLGNDPLRLAAQLHSGGKTAVAAAAQGFEGLFMSLVLKEMRQTLEPGGLFGKDTGDINGGLFDMFLGQHLTKAGGFGLARMMQHHLNLGGGK